MSYVIQLTSLIDGTQTLPYVKFCEKFCKNKLIPKIWNSLALRVENKRVNFIFQIPKNSGKTVAIVTHLLF